MSLPRYECPRIACDFTLTGKVDDPLWQQAPAVPLADALTGQPGKYRTTARMLYSADYLYIAFECEDNFVWGTYTEHDSPIFSEECVEAFICPSGKVRQYYEINVSPRNTVFDSYILNGFSDDGARKLKTFENYTCEGLITQTHIDGELGVPGARGWSAEYAIPFSMLIGADHLTPEPGDEWRLNLYRIDSVERNKLELYAWSPTWKFDFHRPQCFGILEFT